MSTAKGALLEYGDSFFGPIPSLVLFQYNPEQLQRSIESNREVSAASPEVDQAGDSPIERISMTAHFSAADRLAEDDPIARATGVGPELAALEQMVHPSSTLVDFGGAVVDEIGSALGEVPGGAVSVPREKFPRVLFVWGIYRVLPVVITGLQITETKFDFLLNPTSAEVELQMSVVPPHRCSDDIIAKGAYAYSSAARETMAATNLGNVIRDVVVEIESLAEGAL